MSLVTIVATTVILVVRKLLGRAQIVPLLRRRTQCNGRTDTPRILDNTGSPSRGTHSPRTSLAVTCFCGASIIRFETPNNFAISASRSINSKPVSSQWSFASNGIGSWSLIIYPRSPLIAGRMSSRRNSNRRWTADISLAPSDWLVDFVCSKSFTRILM